MANRYIMQAWRMAHEGQSIADIRFFLDTRATAAPDYIKLEAERRAEAEIERRAQAKPERQRSNVKKDRGTFPLRGERRNGMFGRLPQGNTKPEDRERCGFRYHPNAPQAQAARSRKEAERAKAAAHDKIMRMFPATDPVAIVMAMLSRGVGRNVVMKTTTSRTSGRGQ
jgi:hypothetical protein